MKTSVIKNCEGNQGFVILWDLIRYSGGFISQTHSENCSF